MPNSIFEKGELIRFFSDINKLGETILFSQWDTDSKVFLIRHDIDLDLIPAFNMALLEKEHNIKSSFFVMVSNSYYNVLSEKNKQILKDITQLGFEIGLHFDPTVYNTNSLEDLQNKLDFEAGILENSIGQKINSVSLHKPSMYQDIFLFNGYFNTYDPLIFNNDVYLSDSSMNFRGKDPFVFIQNIKQHSIQILLHPIHYNDELLSYKKIVKKSVLRFAQNIDTEFRAMNPTYSKTVEETFIDHILNHE